ncbi:hypothetical protein BDP27DRAFT_1210691 [Rhodocollybia butyracea]|uniref:FAD-binding FR-type domain-containing protein n=1 Tax=Rhodocollybia butyracea TaxID=206335 RepID=A0A9P5Q1M5_9AGAR|nr:hypothetical protein BDP27DRAFT_1210691 [Rhodocollybia butyracea]
MLRPTIRSLNRRHYSTTSQPRKNLSSLAAGFVLSVGALTSFYIFFPHESRGALTSRDKKLSSSYFTPCTVTQSEPCGPNARLITLSLPQKLLPDPEERQFSAIWSIFIKDDDIQVERPYTPLEGVDSNGQMKIWIKKYTHGEVGRWLHSKKVGDEVEIRGPLQTWLWKSDDAWDEVVMISGGTGIAPFYQLYHQIISKGVSAKTRFTLLHSSRSPSELPPPEIMQQLSLYAVENPERFRFLIYVDSDSDHGPNSNVGRVGRIDKDAVASTVMRTNTNQWWIWPFKRSVEFDIRRTLFLVCGPEPMIAAIAGPYGRNLSQGLVGGALAELGATSSQVYKL